MAQTIHEMLAGQRRNLLKYGAASVALAASLLATPAFAQEPAASPAAGAAGPASQAPAPGRGGAVESPASQTGTSNFVDSLIPGLQFTASLNLSETYSTNSLGASSALGSGPDWITLAGITLGVNEHSRRVSLDATYTGLVNYYAKDSQPTQFTNNLQAVANVIAIPDYVNIIGRAFAQPVMISNIGSATAYGYSNNASRNSYGYSIGPDVTFHLGNFAQSETNATYSAAYFTNLNGAPGFTGIPGIPGPQNTTSRSVSETLTSGPDFSRLSWSLVGLFSEMDRPQGLFGEKSGIATLRYAITREIALLGTGGYDKITNASPLTRDVSGPVGMGGFELTFGEDFLLQLQAGEKYNDFSFLGNLRYNLTATAVITGSATDTITTPEGDMLNNLSNLTAAANGQLTSGANIYSGGTASSLGSFSAQPMGSPSYNQAISRIQRVNLGFAEDFEREHFNVSVFGMRLTQLSGIFIGPPTTTSWGLNATVSHDISRLLQASIHGDYNNYQALGGNSKTYIVGGQLSYAFSPDTRLYFRTDYLNRNSSQALQALSPFTRSFEDVRVTIGLTHTIL